MVNIDLPNVADYQDVQTTNSVRTLRMLGMSRAKAEQRVRETNRGNARTPVQWDDSPNGGFTTGTPWMAVNPNYPQINAEAALADPESVFYHYQKLIRLRKTYDLFRDGAFTLLCPEDERVFAYSRDTKYSHLLVVCNFTAEQFPFDAPENFRGARMLLSNYSTDSVELRPYEAAILYYEDGARKEI